MRYKKIIEPITKAVTDTSGEIFEETKYTTKEFEKLNESNVQVQNLKNDVLKWSS